MTHQELLEILEHTAQDGMADEPIFKALKQVVELHKLDPDFKEYCDVCWWEDNEKYEYPCPTITAIEQALQ